MTDTTETSPEPVKKPAKEKEVLVVHDQGSFVHWTGDTYEGFFEAKKKDKSVRMNGPGTYKTAEGDAYSCTWEYDKISPAEEVAIAFADGARYEGRLKDWCYTGPVKYFYPDDGFIQCDFVENCPVGPMTLNDPNGHVWLGNAEQGFAWFEPVNHYYVALERMQKDYYRKRESAYHRMLRSMRMSRASANPANATSTPGLRSSVKANKVPAAGNVKK